MVLCTTQQDRLIASALWAASAGFVMFAAVVPPFGIVIGLILVAVDLVLQATFQTDQLFLVSLPVTFLLLVIAIRLLIGIAMYKYRK